MLQSIKQLYGNKLGASDGDLGQVKRISYKESTVFVKLAMDAVEKSPEHRLIPNGAAVPAQHPLAL
jgi:hypothetical protein